MIVYVDIDETICETPDNRNYELSTPNKYRIEKINALYDRGHTIIYWTARGTGSGIDWRETGVLLVATNSDEFQHGVDCFNEMKIKNWDGKTSERIFNILYK